MYMDRVGSHMKLKFCITAAPLANGAVCCHIMGKDPPAISNSISIKLSGANSFSFFYLIYCF